MIEPVFEELARSKNRANGGVAFTKIDLSVGMSGAVASEYAVRVTPTFVFFLDGTKVWFSPARAEAWMMLNLTHFSDMS